MKLEIGRILKAQGVKGEVKIECYLDNSRMLSHLKQFYIGANSYSVESIRYDGSFCYVKFAGISDRNSAETLRGWTVFVDKDSIELPNERYFISDLVDCRVTLDDGSTVGVVREVLQYGAADVFVCDNEGTTVSFPFLKDLVKQVNIQNKSIVLRTKRFAEVVVYEN